MDRFLCEHIKIGGFGIPKFEIGGEQCYNKKRFAFQLFMEENRYRIIIDDFCSCFFANTFFHSIIEELSISTEDSQNLEQKLNYKIYKGTFGEYLLEYPERHNKGLHFAKGYFLDLDFYFRMHFNRIELHYVSKENLDEVLEMLLQNFSQEEKDRLKVEMIMNLKSLSEIKSV